jgi:hypothetical protein
VVVGAAELDRVASEGDGGEDLTDWLADQWWTPFAMCTLFVAVGLWMIRSMILHRGRGHQLRRAAEAAGMMFSEQDGHAISRTNFKHFGGGEGRGWTATNVVTNRARDGLLTHGFDVRSWSEMEIVEGEEGDLSFLLNRSGARSGGSSRTVRRTRGATRSAAVTDLPLNAPRLLIARENVASKLFAAATRVDLDVESEMFNRSYHVIGESRDFARTLLDARVVDLMTRTEGRISFEFVGSKALLTTVLLEPELVPGLVRLAEELRSVIPRLAVDRWPRAVRQTSDIA